MNQAIEYVEALAPKDEERMSQDLIAYERAHGIDVNYKKFSLVLRDDAGNLAGALTAFTAFAEIYVEDMWVHSDCRRQGLGRKLLEELERRFQGKGFNNINLVTNTFQAPEFYEKCGFQIEFIRENKFHPELTKLFFVKFFNDQIQTQGILKG